MTTAEPDRPSIDRSDRVFTRQQALAAGHTPDEIRWALTSGRWLAIRRGHYASAATVESLDEAQRHRVLVDAVLMHLRCNAVVSHRSAALLHGLPRHKPLISVSLTTHRGDRRTAVGADIRTSRDLALHRQMLDGVAITSLGRTVIDIARSHDLAETLVVADAAVSRGLLTGSDLDTVLDDLAGWPGIDSARRAVRAIDPRCDHPLRSWCRGLLLEQRLPAPQSDVGVSAAGVDLGRYAFVWPAQRTLVALDPQEGPAADRLAELRRRRVLHEQVRRNGYEVLALDPAEIESDPAAAAQRIRAAFDRPALVA